MARQGIRPPRQLPLDRDKLVARAARRVNQHRVTQDLYVVAAERILERGGWLASEGVEPLSWQDADVLLSWAQGLAGCGHHPVILGRDECGHTEVVLECCSVPPCPRYQHKQSAEWTARGVAVFEWFERLRVEPQPRTPEWCDRARDAQRRAKGAHHRQLRRQLDAALCAAHFAEHGRGQRWRHLQIGVKGDGLTKPEYIDKVLDVRAKLARFLEREYHASAIFAAVDQGTRQQRPHLHLAVLADYMPREKLQRWLRSLDCTVPGCSHEADDRCPRCKAEKRACDHPRDDGRPRCNGSWYVHVEEIGAQCPVCRRRVKEATCCGRTFRERVRGGFNEVLKYACAPVGAKADVPVPGEPFTEAQLVYAERVLQFYLETRHRHRIETYGAAKLDVVELGLVEVESARPRGCCPCGKPWDWAVQGSYRRGYGYVWGAPFPASEWEDRWGDSPRVSEEPGCSWVPPRPPGFIGPRKRKF